MKKGTIVSCFFYWILVIGRWHSSFSQAHPSSSGTSSKEVLTLFQDMWHWRIKQSPEFATQIGINDNTAGRLDSFAEETFQDRKLHCQTMLKTAERISDELTFSDKINLDAFTEMIQNYIDNLKYLKFFHPVTALEGPQLHLPHLITKKMILESYNDYQKLLSRYGKLPQQTQELLGLMRENIKSGIMPHNISMEGILGQFSELAKPTFFDPFLHIPREDIKSDQRKTLRQQADERIFQDVLPSFQILQNFIKEEYLRNSREDIAISSLPDGAEYYTALLSYYTSTKLSPQQIHSHGIAEVDRLINSAVKMSTEFDLKNSSLSSLLSLLKPHTSFNQEENLLQHFKNSIFQKAARMASLVSDTLPLDNLMIKNATYNRLQRERKAWYESPSMDGASKGLFHVDLNQITKAEVLPLSLHYSYPGKHLHTIFLQITPSIPNFRKIVEISRWALNPVEFSYNTAFVEGWALYSESLGEEEGIYTHPLEKLMVINRQLISSSRLVVDTGIHALGWSYETAFDYLKRNTAMSPEEIKNDLKRIITWPGQACSAKVGEMRLRELRQTAQNALGKYFVMKDYNHMLLECTNPFHIVHKCVTKYITEVLSHGEEDEALHPRTTEANNVTDVPEQASSGGEILKLTKGYLGTVWCLVIILMYFR